MDVYYSFFEGVMRWFVDLGSVVVVVVKGGVGSSEVDDKVGKDIICVDYNKINDPLKSDIEKNNYGYS